ncbi:MAG TPA: hypothetical protein VHN99_04850, partial [Deinococcales bacterium]|nr:hypothetical protein [Deinococcales bacterium]
FLGELLAGLDDETLLVLTSDHGNFEDLSIKTHTTNPVPLAAVGPGAAAFAGVRDLSGVAGALAAALDLP